MHRAKNCQLISDQRKDVSHPTSENTKDWWLECQSKAKKNKKGWTKKSSIKENAVILPRAGQEIMQSDIGQWPFLKDDDSWVNQDCLCTDFEDAADDHFPDEKLRHDTWWILSPLSKIVTSSRGGVHLFIFF